LRRLVVLAVLASALAGCGGGGSGGGVHTLTIVVNAPFSRSPYIGQTIARGVELGVKVAGELRTGEGRYVFRVQRLDTGLSAGRAVANVRKAVDEGAVAIVDEGTGVDASWRVANRARIPICIAFQGGTGLVDPTRRPNVFRIAPTDHGISFRLAEYLIPKGLRAGLLTDDTGYGQEGRAALDKAFGSNPEAVAIRLRLPATATDLAPEVLRARRAHATALLVWGQAATIAKVLTAARSAGWEVPVYTPPSGEDPLIRQHLADHPEWVDGLTFASGRMTAELGPQAWYTFQSRYESAYGAEQVGVTTSDGLHVIQPPDYAMYAYDFVHVLAAAIQAADGAKDRAAILRQLNQVTVQGANGDERGFNLHNHDGVVDDDVYFARFHDMTYAPVKDDPLSATLPTIEQGR
jgi:branched-chain amino acid transport system substrate-binding protein